MRMAETFRMTLINLRQNRFKVLLTSLGVIIGSLTIILVIAIGQGGEKEITDQFKNMSAETIYINIDYTSQLPPDMETLPKITPSHLAQIKEENPYLKDIYLRASLSKEVAGGGKKEYREIAGVTEGYLEISNLSLLAGEDFSEEERENRENVMVIGHTLASQMFGSAENAVGQFVKVDGLRFEVVGVLEKKAEGMQGLTPDETAFVPYQTAEKEGFLEEGAMPQAVGLAQDLAAVEKAMERIRSTLDYVLDNATYYVVEDAGSRMEAATQSARTMKVLLTSVAAIVFLVGGIGIMNVLFVSVKERTREIGILKALGTKRKDILLQFLLESLLMGVFGGLAGCVLGTALLPLMRLTEIPTSPSWRGPLLALAFAVLTAVAFGFYPAYKASRLKPIDALNYE